MVRADVDDAKEYAEYTAIPRTSGSLRQCHNATTFFTLLFHGTIDRLTVNYDKLVNYNRND